MSDHTEGLLGALRDAVLVPPDDVDARVSMRARDRLETAHARNGSRAHAWMPRPWDPSVATAFAVIHFGWALWKAGVLH
jgi:hypothetical protein